jgi:Protein of unknown function (DUF3489)
MNTSITAPAQVPAKETAKTESDGRRGRKGAKRTAKARPTRTGTKTAKILRLLERPNGASLTELTKASGWQPHSIRGFLSGAVRGKMRLKITSIKREDGERAYHLPTK